MKKLNLGCGRDIKKNYINLDKVKLDGIDIVHDLNKFPYPFKDNEFDEVLCQNILEHINDPIKVMEEIWRISKPNAIIKVQVPYWASKGAVSHLEHKHYFDEGSFNYFKEGNIGDARTTKARFKSVLIYPHCNPLSRFKKYLPFKKFFSKFLINIYDTIYYELKVIKN